ncbi:RiPP maturation radical SAM C-methyltransferase [Kitasatospora sp. NPDC006697]|uniref:RiPP maturation radical SAM C-methyltransferase n=1 Tax=Kitasatospora sp. NPDC006697 TaxID=3364020 RepID=UPI003686599B
MLSVAFVNMPFADWNRPSFALAQLSTMVRQTFDGEVEPRVCYLNQDFAEFFGAALYESLSVSHDHVDTGIGDWLFRELAFPGAPDTTAEYFRRYYRGERWESFRGQIIERRQELRQFCLELIDRYGLAEADVVGFSSMFAQHVPSLALAQLIKERRAETITVLGGANCEAPMGAVIAERVPAVDYVFSGPALGTFREFLRCLLDGDPGRADAVPGIITRRNCGQPRYRQAIGADRELDDICRPDYQSFFQALSEHGELRATGSSEPMLFFETSRGCWWGQRSHCTFCGLNGESMAYRAMSPEHAVDQFNWLFGYAPEYTKLFCTDNVMPRNYAREVFPRLSPPPGVSIFYEVKLPLSQRDMKAMVAAGVTIVQPGVEALASSTLKLMGKGTTAFQNLQFLKSCDEFGIQPEWNLLIGFPGEDPEVYRKYARELADLRHLIPPHGVYMVRFDRFSPYFKQREEYGLDLHPVDYYALTYPFEQADLAELAYFFADHNIAPYMLDAIEWHDQLSSLVAGWREAWYEQGASRPQLRLAEDGPDGPRVLDSRAGGEPVVVPVDRESVQLLRRLSSPAKVEQLAAQWPGGADDLRQRLARLTELRFLFEEDGRVMSLVLTGAEPDEEPEEAAGQSEPAAGGRRLLPLLGGGR